MDQRKQLQNKMIKATENNNYIQNFQQYLLWDDFIGTIYINGKMLEIYMILSCSSKH